MTPSKMFMAKAIPAFWEYIKEDFKPENMVKYGGQTGVYIYKRSFQIEDTPDKVLEFKMEFVEFEENTNKKRKE